MPRSEPNDDTRSQPTLPFRTWGGARSGAGRPRAGARLSRVAHGARAAHRKHQPVHVTLRVRAGLPNLRERSLFLQIKQALAKSNEQQPDHFRLVHYSVQTNHLHLIAEASHGSALARGMQGLAIRIAKRLNAMLQRRGAVFSERYHARALRTPREVRMALAYVLLNRRHHWGERATMLAPWRTDACSSAGEFDGWRPLAGIEMPPPQRDIMRPGRSFLLAVLWRKHGLIDLDEIPGRDRERRRATRA